MADDAQSISFAFGPDRVKLTAEAGPRSVDLHLNAKQAANVAKQLAQYAAQASAMQETNPEPTVDGETAVHAPPMTLADIGSTREGDVALTMLDENGIRFAFRIDQATARSIARSIADNLGLGDPEHSSGQH